MRDAKKDAQGRRRLPRIALCMACAALVAGCAMPKPKMPKISFKMPRVHKVTVQQGNVITQEMIDRLKPGMTREQVAFVMGEPVVRNTFNQDRWDYVYTIEAPGRFEDEKRVTLYFQNGLLSSFAGDYAPSSVQNMPAAPADGAATNPQQGDG